MILTGDRNIGKEPKGTAPGTIAATSMNMVNGPFAASVGLAIQSQVYPAWEWTDPDLHQGAGNLGMVDGSVQQTSLGGLDKALSATKDSIPYSLWPAIDITVGNMIINMP